jgi:hypothetical protein
VSENEKVEARKQVYIQARLLCFVKFRDKGVTSSDSVSNSVDDRRKVGDEYGDKGR